MNSQPTNLAMQIPTVNKLLSDPDQWFDDNLMASLPLNVVSRQLMLPNGGHFAQTSSMKNEEQSVIQMSSTQSVGLASMPTYTSTSSYQQSHMMQPPVGGLSTAFKSYQGKL